MRVQVQHRTGTGFHVNKITIRLFVCSALLLGGAWARAEGGGDGVRSLFGPFTGSTQCHRAGCACEVLASVDGAVGSAGVDGIAALACAAALPERVFRVAFGEASPSATKTGLPVSTLLSSQ